MPEQPGLSFAVLLRQLRAEAGLTQEELAEAASVSPRSVSDLERGINRTARRDTALLLAGALGLDGPARELFVAVARGRTPATELLAAGRGVAPDAATGQAGLGWLLRAVVDSPYRGLSAFEEQDAAFFFGREAATTQVLERMSRHVAGTALLAVSGASGAGKSSLLRAGVMPRVRAEGLAPVPGSQSWVCLLLTPTHAPLDELALRVALLAGTDAAAVRRGLDTSPEGFALTARQAALARPPRPEGGPRGPEVERDQPSQQRLLLVVDQFEELFTQCADEEQRRAFIVALHAAGTAGPGPDQAPAVLVVLGVRADFETRCADYPQLADAVQDRYLVTPMTERQLRMAITEPAKKAGSQVDDGLVDVLLADVRTRQPGASGAGMLPLLSHALDQAWRSRSGTTLTLADYERAGGIEGAVADSAQRAYDRLTPAQQTAARQIFTRLTATSSDGLDTADRATRVGLTEGKSAAEVQDVDAVLEAFAGERLLTLAADTVEISHEVLLTAWPLLRDTWLADTHADRIVRTRLHSTAAEWARHSRDPSYLYSGSLLQAANETAVRIGADPARNPPLSPAERDFLHASGSAHRRRTHGRRAMIAGLLALTLIATATAGIAVHNAASASHQHALALSRQLAAESLTIASINPVTARRLAVAAWHVFPSAQASSVMTNLLADQQQNGILPADPSIVWGVAFSPNGRQLASAGGDGVVRLWNPATGQAVGPPLHAGAQPGVFGVAFSPNGKLLATADGYSGTVRLWNPATGKAVGRPLHATTAGNGVFGVAFSPDGKLLASADGYSGTVRLWNPVTRKAVGAPLHAAGAQDVVSGVAFSRNGKLLASVDDSGTVRLWNPATGLPVGVPLKTGAGGHANGVAFSPNGKLLATAGSDGTARLWDWVTGRAVGPPLHAGSAQTGVTAVAFSRNGKLLATVGGDGTVQWWDWVTGRAVGPPLHAGSAQTGIEAVAFSPNGKLLATAVSDGTVRLWNPASGRAVGAPLQNGGPQSNLYQVAFSPGGKLLATVDPNGTVWLWNLASGQAIGAPLHPAGAQNGGFWVAFSHNGKLLATAGPGGSVRLWNPATRLPVGAPLETRPPGGVNGVAFSPNGKLLATAGGDGRVRLWNPATGQPIRTPHQIGIPNGVNGVVFSPNGKLLATAGGDGRVRLSNPVTGRPVGAPLHADAGPDAMVNGVAFSSDGRLLATAGNHGTARLWDPATGRPVGAPLPADTGPNGGVYGVAFSPNGKLLASADADGTVRLWDTATGQPVGGPIPADMPGSVSWVAFSPDGKLLATVGSDDTVRLWNVSLFTHPYAALCADVGPPTRQDWAKYAPGEAEPRICS